MRFVGSNAVTLPSDAPSGPMWNFTAPPSRGSSSVGNIHALDAFRARDRVPDLLGCGRDRELELEAVGGVRRHDSSSVSFDGCDGTGCGRDDEAMRPPVIAVVASDEVEHGGRELVRERGAVFRGREPHLGVERERRHSPADCVRQPRLRADLVHDAARERDEVVGRQLIGNLLWPSAVAGDRGGRDDVRGRRRAKHALRDPAAHSDLGQLDEPVRLEGAEVVVHLLPREPDTSGERRR